jgi:hypothetical protein
MENCQPYLTQIVGTTCPPCSRSRRQHGRKGELYQQRDDRDDKEQLDNRKPTPI